MSPRNDDDPPVKVDRGDRVRGQYSRQVYVTGRPQLRGPAIDELPGVVSVELRQVLDHRLLLTLAVGDRLQDALVGQLHLVGNAEKCLQFDIESGKQQGGEVMLAAKVSE